MLQPVNWEVAVKLAVRQRVHCKSNITPCKRICFWFKTRFKKVFSVLWLSIQDRSTKYMIAATMACKIVPGKMLNRNMDLTRLYDWKKRGVLGLLSTSIATSWEASRFSLLQGISGVSEELLIQFSEPATDIGLSFIDAFSNAEIRLQAGSLSILCLQSFWLGLIDHLGVPLELAWNLEYKACIWGDGVFPGLPCVSICWLLLFVWGSLRLTCFTRSIAWADALVDCDADCGESAVLSLLLGLNFWFEFSSCVIGEVVWSWINSGL